MEVDICSHNDPVFKTSAMHPKYLLALDFVASPDAPVAVDAFAEVGAHVGMRIVSNPLLMVAPWFVAYLVEIQADLVDDFEQFLVTIGAVFQPFFGVVGEHEFNDVLP